MNQTHQSGVPLLLAILLVVDLLFILVYAACSFGALPNSNMFSLGFDGGYPEIYQYIKLAWSALLLMRSFLVTLQFGFLVWAALFVYMLLDDSLRLHERAGMWITTLLLGTAVATDTWRHVVEFGYAAGVGILLLGPLIPFYRSSTPEFRAITRGLAFFLVALAFFGVAVDLLNSLTSGGWFVKGALGTIEESGEMFVLSLTVGYLLFLRLGAGAEENRVATFLKSTAASIFAVSRPAVPSRVPPG